MPGSGAIYSENGVFFLHFGCAWIQKADAEDTNSINAFRNCGRRFLDKGLSTVQAKKVPAMKAIKNGGDFRNFPGYFLYFVFN